MDIEKNTNSFKEESKEPFLEHQYADFHQPILNLVEDNIRSNEQNQNLLLYNYQQNVNFNHRDSKKEINIQEDDSIDIQDSQEIQVPVSQDIQPDYDTHLNFDNVILKGKNLLDKNFFNNNIMIHLKENNLHKYSQDQIENNKSVKEMIKYANRIRRSGRIFLCVSIIDYLVNTIVSSILFPFNVVMILFLFASTLEFLIRFQLTYSRLKNAKENNLFIIFYFIPLSQILRFSLIVYNMLQIVFSASIFLTSFFLLIFSMIFLLCFFLSFYRGIDSLFSSIYLQKCFVVKNVIYENIDEKIERYSALLYSIYSKQVYDLMYILKFCCVQSDPSKEYQLKKVAEKYSSFGLISVLSTVITSAYKVYKVKPNDSSKKQQKNAESEQRTLLLLRTICPYQFKNIKLEGRNWMNKNLFNDYILIPLINDNYFFSEKEIKESIIIYTLEKFTKKIRLFGILIKMLAIIDYFYAIITPMICCNIRGLYILLFLSAYSLESYLRIYLIHKGLKKGKTSFLSYVCLLTLLSSGSRFVFLIEVIELASTFRYVVLVINIYNGILLTFLLLTLDMCIYRLIHLVSPRYDNECE